ncbi:MULTISPECIES: plasmid partitioning protein RepB [unclassified Rhizobium]|uniref:plasmid partitioning protein RepB n=1 Tax=unclassified Rhizobium TaxID=2613769 RepID=UPI000701173E|nr:MULTISPECIES: plasmid partitioning protein RepB [unclassified Rhizobium]KQV33711.1 plasmid partitioning protein RepB [Rhizobium sp. Root1212]KRD23255.1 plasmid partitioning protein RepB [Rhizobium sp. Root268]
MAGGNRKNELRSLFSGGPIAPAVVPPRAPETKSMLDGPELTAVNSTPAPDQPRASSGAVKAMGLTLGAITREAEEARHLRQALSEGERVLTLDPAAIDQSFVSDRMGDGSEEDADFLALVESIRAGGQQSPILVRPHPKDAGRYETAYGHRRLRAARKLGIKVKAIVRQLSDDELVLAQGKENAERRNLSFIERALFAEALLLRGFDRKVVGEALSVDKTELSRLLQVAEAVPERLARLIGPAPKAGRNRWMALAEFLSSEGARVRAIDEATNEACRAADSDTRFAMVLARLQSRVKPEPVKPEELKDDAGRVYARLKRGKTMRIEFAAGTDDAFFEEIAALVAERFRARKGA